MEENIDKKKQERAVVHLFMKAEIGKYYYAPHRRSYGVWQWDWVSEKGASGRFV